MGIHLRAIRVSRDLNINTPVPQRLADELSKLILEKVLQTYQGLVIKKSGKGTTVLVLSSRVVRRKI